MYEILIPIFIIVTLLIIYKIYNNLKPRIRKQKIFQMISERLDANNSDIQLSNSKSYDFTLTINNEVYALKIVSIEKNSEITINNPVTWEMHFGGGEYIGKPYRHHRYLREVVPFLKLKTEAKKIVIVTPDAKRILKWINESEMIIVSPNQTIDGVRIMNIDDFFNFILLT
ncbi:MAG: hypothetical protein ACOX40_03835 [Bacilli bacterium]|nr:hypothetical protein [Acholeplasmataceae bacterium]